MGGLVSAVFRHGGEASGWVLEGLGAVTAGGCPGPRRLSYPTLRNQGTGWDLCWRHCHGVQGTRDVWHLEAYELDAWFFQFDEEMMTMKIRQEVNVFLLEAD